MWWTYPRASWRSMSNWRLQVTVLGLLTFKFYVEMYKAFKLIWDLIITIKYVSAYTKCESKSMRFQNTSLLQYPKSQNKLQF